ncbi:hypothetical protein N7468_003054 [Penicillium chermesinum]|uniref:Uncharacterized protein n=1 Tax=Penicillium chermesinum TaxID=63820 RepID=A0A9W9TR82_9EURO|nr:uncharacterized protein N7468_003054 [Penicillium chermesinum]KAJ5238435.1 hypothetical protein N7468_003054 [Penicillium chermesinum]
MKLPVVDEREMPSRIRSAEPPLGGSTEFRIWKLMVASGRYGSPYQSLHCDHQQGSHHLLNAVIISLTLPQSTSANLTIFSTFSPRQLPRKESILAMLVRRNTNPMAPRAFLSTA